MLFFFLTEKADREETSCVSSEHQRCSSLPFAPRAFVDPRERRYSAL